MYKPMLDMSWMLTFLIVGHHALIVAIPFTIMIETWLLKRSLLKKRSVGRVLLDTLAMNLVSGIFGYFFNAIAVHGISELLMNLLVLHPHVDYYQSTTLWAVVFLWFVMVFMFALASTFVETPVLLKMEGKLLRDIPRKQTFSIVMKINIWSNLMVFLVILIFLISLNDPSSQGGNFFMSF